MAKLTEIVVSIEADGVDKVLTALKQVDGAQTKVSEGSKTSEENQRKSNENTKLSWSALATGINQSLGIINSAISAGKAVYNFAEEGAQLEYAAGKFDRLSEAAGTSADVLLNDLKSATRGMVSDAELMGSAGDFMALGLAKSHDEVVRLTNVAGALGMNMNQLVLTLTNKTTMRFDALGVSVDGFDEKVKALEATGLSADKAFSEAFLQQAEAQIEKVGHVADTTAGQFKAAEASFANYFNTLKTSSASGFGDVVDWFGDQSDLSTNAMLVEEMSAAAKGLGLNVSGLIQPYKTWWGSISDVDGELVGQMGTVLNWAETTTKAFTDSGTSAEDAQKKTAAMFETYGTGVAWTAQGTQDWADANDRIYGSMDNLDLKMAELKTNSIANVELMKAATVAYSGDWESMSKMAVDYDKTLTAISDNNDNLEQLRAIVAGTSTEFNGVAMSVEDATKNIELLELAGEELEAAYAQIGTNMTFQMLQATMAIGGYTESEITSLTDFMVQNGMISQDAANAMVENYSNAMETANALELEQKIGEILADISKYENGLEIVDGKLVDAKTGEVMADISDFLDGMTEAELLQLDPKIALVLAELAPYLEDIMNIPDPDPKTVNITGKYFDPGLVPNVPAWVNIRVNYIDGGYGPNRAIGGEVYPGKSYTWNEPGREGEMLLTEKYGRVMSNHEVSQAIRDAQLMTQAAVPSQNVNNANNSNNRNVTYQINSPQYKNEPVLTLSEHLRILSTLERLA